MVCRTFNEKISLYIDNSLNEVDKKEFELHLLTCKKCRESYEIMLKIIKELNETEEAELPDNYGSELRTKLEETQGTKKRRMNWKVWSGIAAGLLILVVSVALIDINFNFGNMKKNFDMAMDAPDGKGFGNLSGMPQSEEAPEIYVPPEDRGVVEFNSIKNDGNSDGMVTATDEVAEETSKAKQGKKIIQVAYIDLEVEEYDKNFNKVLGFVNERNGYIENSQTGYISYNRSDDKNLKTGYMKLRVPQDTFEETLKFIKDLGVVQNEQVYENDVSYQYYDKENMVKNLKIQEERLREILEKAENVEELILVENELRRIRTEIDGNVSVLNQWDRQVTMSSVTLNLIEVENLEKEIKSVDESIWTKARKGFVSTINKLIHRFELGVIKLITVLPVILLVLFMVGIILLILTIIIRRINRKANNSSKDK